MNVEGILPPGGGFATFALGAHAREHLNFQGVDSRAVSHWSSGICEFYCTFSRRLCLLDCNASGHREQISGLIPSALRICGLMGVTMTDGAMSRKQWPFLNQEGRDLIRRLKGLRSRFKGGEWGGV